MEKLSPWHRKLSLPARLPYYSYLAACGMLDTVDEPMWIHGYQLRPLFFFLLYINKMGFEKCLCIHHDLFTALLSSQQEPSSTLYFQQNPCVLPSLKGLLF